MEIFKEVEEEEIGESEAGTFEEYLGLGFRGRWLNGGERWKVRVPQLQLMVKYPQLLLISLFSYLLLEIKRGGKKLMSSKL